MQVGGVPSDEDAFSSSSPSLILPLLAPQKTGKGRLIISRRSMETAFAAVCKAYVPRPGHPMSRTREEVTALAQVCCTAWDASVMSYSRGCRGRRGLDDGMRQVWLGLLGVSAVSRLMGVPWVCLGGSNKIMSLRPFNLDLVHDQANIHFPFVSRTVTRWWDVSNGPVVKLADFSTGCFGGV